MADLLDAVDNYRSTYTDPYAAQRQTNKTAGQNLNMVMSGEQTVSVNDFLNLMVMQIRNQDFLNPMDDMDFVTQLAQFATMQQMQELAEYSKYNYVSSLIGQTVTASKFMVNGDTNTQTGKVEKVTLAGDEYTITVNGENYTLAQIMELKGNTSDIDFSASGTSLTQESIANTWVEISIPPTTEDPDIRKHLKYSVYYSTEDMGTDPDEIMAKGTLNGQPNRSYLTADIISGLKPGTDYYINVVVTDSSGAKTAYKPLEIHTTGTAAETPGDEL